LKMEGICCSYQITWCHNPKDHNFNLHCHENPEPYVQVCLAVCVDTKFFVYCVVQLLNYIH
jgi:hypothetical protein